MKNLVPKSIVCLCLAGFGLTGCATSSLLKLGGEKDETVWATPEQPPIRMIAMWEPAEGHGVDGMPTRGFAGQILFVGTEKSSLAVKGDVAVYVFDDVGSAEEQSKPIHRFDFSSEAWDLHRHKGSLGTTYNVFIPYTRKDWIYQAQCSLLIRYKTEKGDLNSEMVAVTLPGPRVPETMREAAGQEKPPVNTDVLMEQVEANYRKLQESKRELETAGADSQVNRRSERIGTITDRGGQVEIAESGMQGATSGGQEESTEDLKRKLAMLEAQINQMKSDNGQAVQQVSHQQTAANDPFSDLRRSRQHPLDNARPEPHPLQSDQGYEGFPGRGESARGAVQSSGRMKLGEQAPSRQDLDFESDRQPRSRTTSKSTNSLFDDLSNGSESSIGEPRSNHPLLN